MSGKAVAESGGQGNPIWMLGGLYDVLLSGDETDGTATVVEFTVPVGTTAAAWRSSSPRWASRLNGARSPRPYVAAGRERLGAIGARHGLRLVPPA